MKKLLRTMLGAVLAAGALCGSAFAADAVPVRQGDFYVEVNGEYVTFPDAVPQLKNDRSCLPFVAVFEQLGFAERDMTWDGATGTVTATKPDVLYTPFDGGEDRRGAVTVRLTIGSNTFSVWYEGDTTAAPMGDKTQVVRDFTSEAAPYIDPATSRTYIPFGLVADALGYNVGWDARTGTVIIDDVDAILAENQAVYTMMDKYLAYRHSFARRNQKVEGSYSTAMELLPDDSSQMRMTMDGAYSMLVQGGTKAQFTTRMLLNMHLTVNGEPAYTGMENVLPLTLNMQLRMDLEQGALYYQCPETTAMLGQEGMDNAWFKLDMKDGTDQTGGACYGQLLELIAQTQESSFARQLSLSLKSAALTDASMTTRDSLALINALFADSAFEKSGSEYTSAVQQDGTGAMSFTLYTKGGEVKGYAMEFSAQEEGERTALTARMKDDRLLVELGCVLENGVVMTMSMDGTYTPTGEQPAVQPPADAVVVELAQLPDITAQ